MEKLLSDIRGNVIDELTVKKKMWPHLSEIAQALYDNESVKVLRISTCAGKLFQVAALGAFACVLKKDDCFIKKLFVEGNEDTCLDGAMLIADMMKSNSSVEHLKVTGSGFGFKTRGDFGLCGALCILGAVQCVHHVDLSYIYLHDVEVKAIGRVLALNQCVRVLNVSSCFLGNDGVCAIANALLHENNKNMTNLNLSSNGYTSEGLQCVASMLKSNTTLRILHLSNLTNESDITQLADALSVNHHLKQLHLHGGNSFDWKNKSFKDGQMHLFDAVKRNGTLVQCRGVSVEVEELCEKIQMAHGLTLRTIVLLLCIRRFRRSTLSYIPKDVVSIIGRQLWHTRVLTDVWAKQFKSRRQISFEHFGI